MTTELSNGDDIHDPQANGHETELRELVYQTLERDGLITRLKAQLRAAVFKTIENASKSSLPTSNNPPAYDSHNGRVCRALILDWLEHSRLLYTQDLFQVETSSATKPVTREELIEHLHLPSVDSRSQTILDALLNHRNDQPKKTPTTITTITTLPENIKQSIETKFPTEKINDINRVREHFRSLFSSAFDPSVLDAFLNKMISSSSTSIAKFDYEQICLKWIQACNKALAVSPAVSNLPVNNGQSVTRARRAASPISDSPSSESTSPSTSDNPRKGNYDFPLPTTTSNNTIKSIVKKASDIVPPPLLNFTPAGNNNDDDDDDDETSSSIFSKRNATPAQLNHLKNIDDIIRGDETPRTRTTVNKSSNNGNKDLLIEYDDESVSTSQMSTVDDITVDKASPSPSAHIDYLEDV